MSSNMTPTCLATTGPLFQVFPNEILLEILKYLLVLAPGTRVGTVVEHKWFPFLWAMGPFPRLRHVSKTFQDLAIIAFYEGNQFNFSTGNMLKIDMFLKANAFGNILPALLPPLAVRGYLRHITIDIVMQDFFETDHPVGYTPLHRNDRRACNFIVTVPQLFEYSGGARQLRDLTRHMSGLDVLNLNIIADFRADNTQASIDVFKAARFSVRAGKVTVVVKDRVGATPVWHADLVKAITVE